MATKKHTVAVIGSLNIDFITRTSRLPDPGETFAALSFDTGFGGKGANQAVAAARLAGEDVQIQMVGNVGDDGFGNDYFTALEMEDIDASTVRKLSGEKTGVTNIIVEESTGENRILYVANANEKFGEREDLVDEGMEGDVVVFQLEIPLKTVLHNMHRAREAGKHVMVNPAPAVELPESAFQDMDTLIMNETESEILAGSSKGATDTLDLAMQFLQKGVRDIVIITLGGDGLVYATADGQSGRLDAHKVKVVDTTAAGDTFVGGYAVERARNITGNFDYEKALKFANLAASKTVERAGAMSAIPLLKELL